MAKGKKKGNRFVLTGGKPEKLVDPQKIAEALGAEIVPEDKLTPRQRALLNAAKNPFRRKP